jgi:hypothetical protein
MRKKTKLCFQAIPKLSIQEHIEEYNAKQISAGIT